MPLSREQSLHPKTCLSLITHYADSSSEGQGDPPAQFRGTVTRHLLLTPFPQYFALCSGLVQASSLFSLLQSHQESEQRLKHQAEVFSPSVWGRRGGGGGPHHDPMPLGRGVGATRAERKTARGW